mmetsp:Transcript_13855/g.43459  ORF Transcript_13855/g.43459 Transcript_13855/m.43459 type:complete len:200 (-) Transcript_13855:408-1007(-)
MQHSSTSAGPPPSTPWRPSRRSPRRPRRRLPRWPLPTRLRRCSARSCLRRSATTWHGATWSTSCATPPRAPSLKRTTPSWLSAQRVRRSTRATRRRAPRRARRCYHTSQPRAFCACRRFCGPSPARACTERAWCCMAAWATTWPRCASWPSRCATPRPPSATASRPAATRRTCSCLDCTWTQRAPRRVRPTPMGPAPRL